MSAKGEHAEVGARIEHVRGTLSRDEFAEKLQVAPKTVARWELGQNIPDGEQLLKMWRVFHADPAWVLSGSGSAPPLTARESALLDNYRNASGEGRRALDATGAALAQPYKRDKAA